MKHFFNLHKISILGVLVGGILGYSYYYFIGCESGSCAITSKPINSSVYGMAMGYALFSMFPKAKKSKSVEAPSKSDN